MKLFFRVLIASLTLQIFACTSVSPLEQPTTEGSTDDKSKLDVHAETAATKPVGSLQPNPPEKARSAATATSAQLRDADTLESELTAIDANTSASLPVLPLKLAKEEKNLWVRIRKGFQFAPDLSNQRIKREVAWYAKYPSHLNRTFKRSEPYLFYIVDEAEKRGIPMELALLPFVESAFDPFAYSPGRAAGIWQFIPGTGKHFGLKQTWWYDGRRDVTASTQAAFNYLEELANRFNNDWLLALAAYNSGAGTVSKAIKRNKKRGKPTDYWNLKLPKETSAYVPRLIAISKIVAEPGKFDLALYPIVNEPKFEVAALGSQIDLAKAAALASMSVDDLYLLNPGFNQWATDPLGPHHLVIPVDRIEEFKANLAKLPKNQRVKWTRYVIKKGDSLIKVAKKFKTTPQTLRDINRINGSLIRTGQALLIPSSFENSGYYSLSKNNRLAASRKPGKKGTRKMNHKVRKGDNLWDISRKYKVSTRKLTAWNGIRSTDVLRPGQNLVIWKQKPKTTTLASAADALQNGNGVIRKIAYRVSKGDSLYRIGSRYNVSVNDLAQWNGISTGKPLQPGQRLDIYVNITRFN